MKKTLCVILVIAFIFVLAVPVGAWSMDDMDGTEISMNDFLSLSAYLRNSYTSTKYESGTWRTAFEFNNLDSGERRLFSVGNQGVFTFGHGLLCIYCLPEDFVLNYVTSVKVAVRNNAFSTSFTFTPDDGSLASVSSNTNQIYADDASGYVFYDAGFVFFLIQGTLDKTANDIILSVDIKEGIQDATVILDYADEEVANVVMTSVAVSAPGDEGGEGDVAILSGIGQSLQSVIGWFGQVLPLVTEYPGFIMMIAVPLFVGIVTWVTTIYKRRRG